ncbi:hypothetical protein [Pseudopedobacter beijingensis]|uniref:Uncharacterized protein n=1 Tax=Pseudopedobacter beijingensis TaxID=1207056 RepID=A0ABW4IIH2_9SPHI
MKTERIALIGIVIALAVLVWFLVKKSKQNKQGDPVQKSSAPTVGQKIQEGYSNSLGKLTDSEVKNLATKFDLLESEANVLKAMNAKEPTGTMLDNAITLQHLPDALLRNVVEYWQNATKQKVTRSSIFSTMMVDTTEILPMLLRKLRDLGY